MMNGIHHGTVLALFWIADGAITKKRINAMNLMKHRSPAVATTPVDRLASEIFGPSFSRFFSTFPDMTWEHTPRVNIMERADDFLLELEVPGFTKDQLTVELNGNTLTVRGEQSAEHTEGEKGRWTRREFSRSSFERSFVLPKSVVADQIKADQTDGVLKLTLPKAEPSTPQTRTIQIG